MSECGIRETQRILEFLMMESNFVWVFFFSVFFSLPLNGWWVIFTVCFQELCFFLQYEQLMNQYTAYLHQLLIQYCSNSGGFDLRQEKLML